MATDDVSHGSESFAQTEVKEPVVVEQHVDDRVPASPQTFCLSPPNVQAIEPDSQSQISDLKATTTDPMALSDNLIASLASASINSPTTAASRPSFTFELCETSNGEDSLTCSPDFSLPSSPAIEVPQTLEAFEFKSELVHSEGPFTELALRILDVLHSYGHKVHVSESGDWAGRPYFLPVIERCLEKRSPVKMVLPAFPFKSPNKVDKVLGRLPDLGEELALMHLNGLCESIADIYEHGAEICITSDGLVYNDILGIDDAEVWDYSTAIRGMIQARGLHFIKTLRIVDLLGHDRTQELTRDEYLAHAGCYRRELIARFTPKNLDVLRAIESEPDTCTTYKGYASFLSKDLKYSAMARNDLGQRLSKKGYGAALKKIAVTMIGRGKAFAAAIEASCSDHMRLSIHPSRCLAKLSIPLIPQAGTIMTPWHSAIAVGLDGSYRAVHASDGRETHDVVYSQGRPHHLREKSDLWDFGPVKVEFEHLYPCGLIIRPAADGNLTSPPSLREVDVSKVKKLAERQSPVVLRGFADTKDKELYVDKASEMGEIMPWMFGQIMTVKDSGQVDRGSNNVASNEAMPMHYDGVFKWGATIKDDGGNDVKDDRGNVLKTQLPPRFQMFTAITTAPKGMGCTLFAESRLFFKNLPAPYTLSRLQDVKWRLHNTGYWHSIIEHMALVIPHPITGVPCLRWHESWPESKTKYSTSEVTIENDTQDLVATIDKLLYERRVSLRFEWEQGDILIADNTSMMHTRTAFTGNCERELWRIHLDQMDIPQYTSKYQES